jgi:hypothetical protein
VKGWEAGVIVGMAALEVGPRRRSGVKGWEAGVIVGMEALKWAW